jgi:tetratricopeptide (TPR) repeat protein
MPLPTFKYFLILALLGSITQSIAQDSLKKLYAAEKDEVKKGTLMNKILMFHRDNSDSVIHYGRIFLNDFKAAKQSFGEAYTYHSIGIACQEGSSYSLSKENLLKAIELYAELKNDSMQAKANIRLAFGYYTQGDFETAIKTYLKGIELAQRSKTVYSEAWAYNLLGLAFYEKPNPDYKTALEYYLKAIELNTKIHNTYANGMVYLRIGSTYTKLADYKNAEKYLERASVIGDSLNEGAIIKWTLNAYSNYYKARKDYFRSNEIEKRSKALSLIEAGYPGIVIAYRNMAENYSMLSDNKKALESIDSAVYYSLKHEIFQTLPEVYELKSSILDKMGKGSEALVFFKKSVRLKDSLFSVQNSNNINELQTRFETNEKEKAIELLNVEKENDKKVRKVLVIAMVLAVLVIILIVYILIKINSARKLFKKQKMEIEQQKNLVDQKQKEILDSISYAQRIQKALLPTERYIEKNLRRKK